MIKNTWGWVELVINPTLGILDHYTKATKVRTFQLAGGCCACFLEARRNWRFNSTNHPSKLFHFQFPIQTIPSSVCPFFFWFVFLLFSSPLRFTSGGGDRHEHHHLGGAGLLAALLHRHGPRQAGAPGARSAPQCAAGPGVFRVGDGPNKHQKTPILRNPHVSTGPL